MTPTKVLAKKSLKARFVVLQAVIIALVAITLVSFSNLSLPPLGNYAKPIRSQVNDGDKSSGANAKNNSELEAKLQLSQKLLDEKQARINELENNVKSLEADNKKEPASSANETALKASLQKMELQLAEKEATINELTGQVETLQNSRNTNSSSTDKAAIEKLRSEVQKLETRNALLVKLNNDLKKNNEYLSAQQKAGN
jgi:chromosome segregation ATPase